jgi:acyl-CoA thioesterase YciA
MQLISTHPIKKSDLGFHGNLFGGKLLAWIDAAGAALAQEAADTPRMVTVKIDECVFKNQVKKDNFLKSTVR